MAQNLPVLNDIEERFYPMVTGAVSQIKGFFGWGGNEGSLDRLDSTTGRPSTVPAVGSVYGADNNLSKSSPANSRVLSTSHSTASPARPQSSMTASKGGSVGSQLDNASIAASTASSSNHVVQPPRTGSVHNDLSRTKKKLSESPLRAFSVDVNSKSDSNHNASPFRQPLSSTSTDFEPLTACAEEPMFDLEEPDYSTSEKLGRIQFSVSYDFEAMTLTVKIIKAEELAAKDLSGTSDPYVKISLLPDKKHTLTTNIKRKNLNPRWNEVFAFEGFPYNKVVAKTLYLMVIDYDRFSRDDPIGEVSLPLGDLDLATGQTMWKNLSPCKGSVGKLGVLLLSLCYQPAVGCITIVIIKARDLKAKDINGLSDPYVKIWLMHESKKIEKKKTEIKEKNLNPVYNESFIFTVPYERIRQTSLVISVMDYDRMGRNEAIGQIVLGTKSGVMEMKHWNEMFAKSRQAVTQWHILKDFG